jgi:predicted dehydrogenase
VTRQAVHRRLRIGVVGCGSIAQIAHLPNLLHLRDLFEVIGVADASREMSRWTGERFHVATFESHEALIEAGAQALLVATPHAGHADVIRDAIERGTHVLVEKPLCVASPDAEAIATLAERSGVVVQVGYMKRHDDAFAALCADLEADSGRLLGIHALTTEGSSLHRTFQPSGMPEAADICSAKRAEWDVAERCQMQRAIGSQDPRQMAVYRGLFLADLVHDLNLANAVLVIAGEAPVSDHEAHWWNAGRAGTLGFTTAADVRCGIEYVEVPGAIEYQEELVVVTERAVQRVRFPAPYLHRAPTVYEHRSQGDHGIVSRMFRSAREPFVTELERFHATIIDGQPCITPAREAIADLLTLERCFDAGRRSPDQDHQVRG